MLETKQYSRKINELFETELGFFGGEQSISFFNYSNEKDFENPKSATFTCIVIKFNQNYEMKIQRENLKKKKKKKKKKNIS